MPERNRVWWCAVAMALTLLLGAAGARATVIARVDLPTLTDRSERVVRARVVDMQSDWDDQGRMIFTHVALDVSETLLGEASDRVVVRVPGGTVADYTVEMIGAPKFALDEEVVVFLNRWSDGAFKVAGYYQGLSKTETDGAGNRILRGGVCDGMPLAALAERLGQE